VLHKNVYVCCRETVSLDAQWLWDYAIKFARWQHPARGHGARFALV